MSGMLAVLPSDEALAADADGCRSCHLGLGEERLSRPAREVTDDVHVEKGFGCAACHGGDPAAAGMEAMLPARGFRGVPRHRQIAPTCGRCHSDPAFMRQYAPALRVDQVAEYQTSVHGKRLQQRDDPKVATCASCHTAHEIKPASRPDSTVFVQRVAQTCGRCHANAQYMQGYGIPTDQLTAYQRSIHSGALAQGNLAAPTCNSCHGNHGAAPPGVTSVAYVCGTCHSVVAAQFAKSAHAAAFAQRGRPGCAVCHRNHAILAASDAMVGLGPGSACGGCHALDEQGGQGAVAMRAAIDRLRSGMENARATLTRAEHAGMDVSQSKFELEGVQEKLIKARTATHAGAPQAVEREIEPGLALVERTAATGRQALRELRFRREGLAVSAVVILALILGLVLRIRELDRRRAEARPP